MRKIAFCILCVLALVANASTYYGFKIGGVSVNSDNYNNVTGEYISAYDPAADFYVRYNPNNKTLIICNVKIKRSGGGNRSILNESCDGLTIIFKGNNYFSGTNGSPLRFETNTTLKGTPGSYVQSYAEWDNAGSLLDDGHGNCGNIYLCNGCTVTMDVLNLKAEAGRIGSTYHSSDNPVIEGTGDETLIIRNSRVELDGHLYNRPGMIGSLKSLTVDKSYVRLGTGGGVRKLKSFTQGEYVVIRRSGAITPITYDSEQQGIGADDINNSIEMCLEVPLDEEHFPDETVLQYLYGFNFVTYFNGTRFIGKDVFRKDGIEVKFNPNELKVDDLSWLQWLPWITELNVAGNDISRLNVGEHGWLSTINANNCKIANSAQLTADLRKLTALKELRLANNELSSFDYPDTKSIEVLDISHNKISSLGLYYAHDNLKQLNCSYNQLTKAPFNYLGFINLLDITGNKFTDISNFSVTSDCNTLKAGYNLIDCNLALQNGKNMNQIELHVNQLSGDNMKFLIEHLPQVTGGARSLRIFSDKSDKEYTEGNYMPTLVMAAQAKAKGWTPMQWVEANNSWMEIPSYIAINKENFPDDNFRNFLLKQDYGRDSLLSGEEIENITSLNLEPGEWMGKPVNQITNLKGIEFFTELTELNFDKNLIKTVDLSNNKRLKFLRVSKCEFENIDLTANTLLEEVYLNDNKLTTIDFSNNTNLTKIEVKNNELSVLDLKKNSLLANLSCEGNNLESLDLSGNPKLEKVSFSAVKMNSMTIDRLIESLPAGLPSSIYIYGATKLAYRGLSLKQISTMLDKNWIPYYSFGRYPTYIDINAENFPDDNFRDFLLSQDYGTDEKLYVEEAKAITELDVNGKNIANLTGIEHFFNLTSLKCHNNRLTSLDVSALTRLNTLWYHRNALNTNAIDALIESLPQATDGVLRSFYIFSRGGVNITDDNAQVSTVQAAIANAKGWTVERYLQNSWSEVEGSIPIDAAHFPDDNFRNYLLAQDYGKDAKLTGEEILDLTILSVPEKGISSLQGIRYFTELGYLNCPGNNLATLDLRYNKKLTILDCDNNHISSLNLSSNPLLTYISCSRNGMTSLNIAECDSITRLLCSNNLLENLDLTSKPNMWQAMVWGNRLTTLNLAGDNKLSYFVCWGNRINGEGADAMISTLPASIEEGEFKFYYPNHPGGFEEGNELTADQVAEAIRRGAIPYRYDGIQWVPYEGKTDVLPGDVNGDGSVNTGDVSELYGVILGTITDETILGRALITDDDEVNVGDVSALYQIILGQ